MNKTFSQHEAHGSDGGESSACSCFAEKIADTVCVLPRINGVALIADGESCDHEQLLERAYSELLRQEAVRNGFLSSNSTDIAPSLSESEQQVIDAMLEEEIHIPTPSSEECQRYYEAHRQMFTVGQSRNIRHILFAVTPGVNVTALAQRAESALFELRKSNVNSDKFSLLAAELSNCPTGVNGGELGKITPQDCAPELAKELFFNQESSEVLGVMPRLVHTRHGFHIIDVQAIDFGNLPEFEVVKPQIRLRLQAQSRATALRQYMSLLVGRSNVEGLQLDGAVSDLVQ